MEEQLRKTIKKFALSIPSVKRIHTDLENRRSRVLELEGHVEVMKNQMAHVLKNLNPTTQNYNSSTSDLLNLKAEHNEVKNQYSILSKKHEDLRKIQCLVNISNEKLTKANNILLNGNISETERSEKKQLSVQNDGKIATQEKPKAASARKKNSRNRKPAKAL